MYYTNEAINPYVKYFLGNEDEFTSRVCKGKYSLDEMNDEQISNLKSELVLFFEMNLEKRCEYHVLAEWVGLTVSVTEYFEYSKAKSLRWLTYMGVFWSVMLILFGIEIGV